MNFSGDIEYVYLFDSKPHPAAADHSGTDDLEVDSEEDKRDLEELMAEAEQHSQNASLMAYSGEGSLTGASSHHQVWSPTVNFALFTFSGSAWRANQ